VRIVDAVDGGLDDLAAPAPAPAAGR
jgi:hypothetical protein